LAPPEDSSLAYFRAVVVEGMKPAGLSSLETNMVVSEILDAARRQFATNGYAATSLKHIDPGVWPGVWIVCSRSRPTSMIESSSRMSS